MTDNDRLNEVTGGHGHVRVPPLTDAERKMLGVPASVKHAEETIAAMRQEEREHCAFIARTTVGDGCTQAERDVAMLISDAIMNSAS